MRRRQAATSPLLSFCSCLPFPEEKTASYFLFVKPGSFDLRLKSFSTFQGEKTFPPYSMMWDDIDIRMTLNDPYGKLSAFLIGVYGGTNGKTKCWSETLCCLPTTNFYQWRLWRGFKWYVKKINEKSCESSSRSTSGSQLLVGTTKSRDFVWERYVNQALLL